MIARECQSVKCRFLGDQMENIFDVYIRFMKNSRTENGAIQLYPQFDYDLNILMKFIKEQLDEKADSDEFI